MLGTPLRRIFKLFNRSFMVPAFRLGLGSVIVNPLSGYIMVLKTKGRKTGKARYSPVNYAIMDGCVYCMAGWGAASDWLRNLRANPNIEVMLPGGALAGMAEEVTTSAERIKAMRRVLQAAGFAGFMLGFNPHVISDDALLARTSDLPLVRIRPYGIGSSAFDSDGWAWVVMMAGMAALSVALLKPALRNSKN